MTRDGLAGREANGLAALEIVGHERSSLRHQPRAPHAL